MTETIELLLGRFVIVAGEDLLAKALVKEEAVWIVGRGGIGVGIFNCS